MSDPSIYAKRDGLPSRSAPAGMLSYHCVSQSQLERGVIIRHLWYSINEREQGINDLLRQGSIERARLFQFEPDYLIAVWRDLAGGRRPFGYLNQ